MNIVVKRELPAPEEIKAAYPLAEAGRLVKAANDRAVADILSGRDERLLLIIGPCSADREDAALEYLSRLRAVQIEVQDEIVIVPRLYTTKPRTAGDGYKGMLHQPDPNGRPDLLKGLTAIRKLHLDAITQTGFSCADELLYPEDYPLLSDVLSYVAIGARSVENQQHRLTASALDIPVGMKNPLSGDLGVMIKSIVAAQHGHTFIYRNQEVESAGNPYAHAILRGYVNHLGEAFPNYGTEALLRTADLYEASGARFPAVIVDGNHSNSDKRFEEQPRIAREVLASMGSHGRLRKLVKGLMIESYLEDGCQPPAGGVFGQSITDPCLGWEKSRRLIYELAQAWPTLH